MSSRHLSLIEVTRALGECWCAFLGAAVRGETLRLPGGSLGIGGEDHPDTNIGFVHGPDGPAEAVARFAARLRERGLPGRLVVLSTVAAEVEGAARGLEPGPPLPLMCLHAADARRADVAYPTERVSGVDGVREAGLVIGDVFGLPPRVAGDVLGPRFGELPSADIFLARHDGRAIAAAGTARCGSLVGIYVVGVREAHRRRGAGTAVVAAAMDHHIEAGAHLFALVSTPAAERFFANLGFVVADHLRLWTVRPG